MGINKFGAVQVVILIVLSACKNLFCRISIPEVKLFRCKIITLLCASCTPVDIMWHHIYFILIINKLKSNFLLYVKEIYL